ncbi:type VII toxin-antitoxin system MntA family adenylyltransferase antitoxin [Desulfovirgula thermocuniculi]|uniref:type VII toxin-antitoxin system MntA family adenylyltransferase antitoxin n=1 Tax=Desulfovirgula thermocuniculi TaxID=348842 RepID=UPI00146FA888|nr:nucleotidyltransferase domain-containing protein [Desulfovirgula thermocuniculi]
MPETETVAAIAAKYLEEQPDVLAAYLFGSLARGRGRAGSDVDIAVLFAPSLSEKTARFERRLEMELALEERLGLPAQVVDLEAASPELQHQVRLHGRLLVDKDRNRRVAFEVRARRNYLDMEYYRRRRMEIAFKRAGI